MKRFSVIVVTLNAGVKLQETVQSILEQSFPDYEVVVKDGGSSDGSLEALQTLPEQMPGTAENNKIRIFRESDRGIYDAMNQAVSYADGEYLLFLNSGDSFYDAGVLEQTDKRIREQEQKNSPGSGGPCIFYGNVWEKQTGETVLSNPHIDAFACYRNIPCHQVCFYDSRLFAERGYDTTFRVRADYEHFLWCYFVRRAGMIWMPVTVASYEGGGFSETAQNREISRQEHRVITGRYLTVMQRIRFRFLLWITLAPLRRKMAESKRLAGIYQKLKGFLYRH